MTLGSGDWHSDKFLGFSICLIYSKLGAEETGNLLIPTVVNNKSSIKSVFSLFKRPEKEQPRDRKYFNNNHSALAKHHRKNCCPPHSHMHTTKGDEGDKTSLSTLWQGIQNLCHPSPRKAWIGTRIFISTYRRWQDLMRNMEFHLHPAGKTLLPLHAGWCQRQV